MTKGESVLAALAQQLESGLPGVDVLRNTAIPETVGENGLIIVRDGDIDEPETVLGGFRTAFYQHAISIELYVQDADQESRDTAYSALCASLGEALESDITLGGTVQTLLYGQPSSNLEPIEGGDDIKQGLLTLTVEYTASAPLA